jgi:hypothetical protein
MWTHSQVSHGVGVIVLFLKQIGRGVEFARKLIKPVCAVAKEFDAVAHDKLPHRTMTRAHQMRNDAAAIASEM